MKKVYIDCEFNGFGGKLISMALVPEDDNYPEFYREIEMNDQLHPWVRDNVIPHLTESFVTHNEFQNDLATYLRTIEECTIVADWPDDIRHFCESLIVGAGAMINVLHKIKFELDLTINYESKVPHHALHDARAIKQTFKKRIE
jgi:3' exoribonuclease, RNase T-like